jgi:hypothetical protein
MLCLRLGCAIGKLAVIDSFSAAIITVGVSPRGPEGFPRKIKTQCWQKYKVIHE